MGEACFHREQLLCCVQLKPQRSCACAQRPFATCVGAKRGQDGFRARPAFSIGDAWCCGGACRWVGAVLRRCLPRRRRRRHRRRRRPSLVPSRVVHKANTGAARPLGAFARAGTSRRPSRPADWGVQRRLARQYVLHVFSSPCIKTSDAAQAGTCPVPRLALTLTPATIANGTPCGECGVLDL